MIPELGQFALILALLVALVQASVPLTGAAREALFLDEAADPHPVVECYGLRLEIAGAVKKHEVIVERNQHQRGCSAECGHAEG